MATIYCAWERQAFDESQFEPYSGLVLRHMGTALVHLTNGLLPDAEGPNPADDVEYGEGPEAEEEEEEVEVDPDE